MTGVSLQDFLAVSGLLFAIGLWTALRRTNAILILMGIELMLNAVNLNLVSFARYMPGDAMRGFVFALFVLTVAAAEAAVGLAIIIMVVRRRGLIDVNKFNLLRG
jgi:NAD(P)H-quinone oxidoreductase subunit 4L